MTDSPKFVMVPVEPTEEMVNAAPTLSSSAKIKDIYRAMIAAAPASKGPMEAEKYKAALLAIEQRANERAAGNDFLAERDTVYAMAKIAKEALK